MFENYGMIIKTFTTILEFHVKEKSIFLFGDTCELAFFFLICWAAEAGQIQNNEPICKCLEGNKKMPLS